MAEDTNTTQTNVVALEDRISTRLILKIAILILALAAALWTLQRLRMVILLLVLSIFFSYLIAPLVEWFQRPVLIRGRARKLPRTAAIALVYLVIALVVGLIFYSLVPALTAQINAVIGHLPDYAAKVKSYFERSEALYRKYKLTPEWQADIAKELSQVGWNVLQWIKNGLLGILSLLTFLPWLFLVPILSFFMLKDVDVFRAAVVSAFPTRRLRRRIDELFGDASQALAAYVRSLLMACMIIGVLTSIGFTLLGAPFPLLLGVVAGVLEFVPVAGPFLAALIAILVSATVSFKVAGYVLVFLLVLRVLEDYVIYPRLVGHGMEMHPLLIILAVLTGAELGGIIGIFLAIPATALITVVYRHWLEYKGSQGIMAELLRPPPPPQPAPDQGPAQTGQNVPAEIRKQK
jgi:predicted PurR-regulated permease PerM